ncbi:FAD/NAD-binding domain-containing protein [Sanghuangporus baumii]|uniref:FAD/NAD-binding domain-containing protein n=1 Tax=Sanghuangporus baumii TaxID=108892 RepID=A0A9Q5HZ96_SANBA|nr:FAD/NAD-binding domain-containing protein [Sanghuangporus baumii]
MDELGAEMYSVHHADLVCSLYKLATNAGAQINFGSRVISVDNETATVTLGSGKTLKADLIVGADGHQSIVRAGLEPTRKEKLDINYTTYLFTIPASRFKDDQEIPRLLGDARWYMWMGFGWGMSMFGIRNNTVLSCTLFMNEEDVDVSVDWKSQVPVKDLGTEKLGLTPIKADSATRVKVDRENVPEYWYDSSGHVIVVGEAAHASLVGTVHSAALGIEDAAVLGRLLSKLKSKHEIKRFLSAFHEIRHPRSERLSASEQQKVDFITLPAGALSEARDESMRLQMNEGQGDWSASEDSFLTRSWEEFRDAFGYDAFDEADTWWVEWGVLFDRINGSDNSVEDDIFSGQITVERERHACTPSI